MKCRFLEQFSPSDFKWSILSCSANDMPYLPSICELDSYCRDSEHKKCPLFLNVANSFAAALAVTVN